jgi:hypothetical protein
VRAIGKFEGEVSVDEIAKKVSVRS